MDYKETTVCVSGYFDPIHIGHIEYFKKAKQLASKLIVIVNNDQQATLKKGKSFMKDSERVLLISELSCVDTVVLSIDTDRTVCKTLELIKPSIFANGGDQFNNSIPESKICDKYDIKLIDSLGDKIQSSSWLLANSESHLKN